ncbi:MAG: hypothetical protein R3E60_06430 [Alphaproteobacteria bacterium]
MKNSRGAWSSKTLAVFAATTALSSPATLLAADPLKLSLGGFAEYYMVARTQKPLNHSPNSNNNQQKPRGFSMYWEDAEIWFSASTQLDNGVTVGYRVEMETRNADSGGPCSSG